MNTLFTTILVGISLSMDAFSLALIYGMQNFSRKNILKLSLIVGLFHFFMPLIGLRIGGLLDSYFAFNFNFVVGIIFTIIGFEMIMSSLKEEDIKFIVNIVSFLLFGFSVSIDSFTTGIGLKAINDNYFEVSFIFMLCSAIFTFLGLTFGNRLSRRFGNIATISGGVMLIGLAIYYVIK